MNLDVRLLGVRGRRDVQQRGFAGDRDGVGNRAELKREFHRQAALRPNQDRFPDEGAESFLLHDHAVRSDRKIGRQVIPEFVGLEIEFTVRLDVHHLNFGAGNHGPVRILHRPFDAAAVGLREESAACRQQGQDYRLKFPAVHIEGSLCGIEKLERIERRGTGPGAADVGRLELTRFTNTHL